MIPVISLATHEKPGCSPTLIDNILMNSTEKLIGAGVLEGRVSHHHPILCITNCEIPPSQSGEKATPKYDL